MLNEKALPCPFCASEASADGKVTYSKGHVKEQGWGQDTFFFCNCPICGVSNIGIVGHRTQADAIDAWNRRAALPSSPVSELAERLRGLAVYMDASQHAKWNGRKDVPVDGFSGEGKTTREAADRLTALEAENARLRRALEFYADVSKYPAPFTGGMGALWSDCGQIALAALSTAPHGGDHA